MSLYQMMASGLQRLGRTWWGAKIPAQFKTGPDGSVQAIEGGDTHDTGVQAFAQELMAAFSSQDPIPLTAPLTFVAPQNVATPAIRILIDRVDGGSDGTIVNNIVQPQSSFYIPQIMLQFQDVNSGEVVNIYGPPAVQPVQTTYGSGTTPQPPPSPYATAKVLTDVNVTASASLSGCTLTITMTVTKTYVTLNFIGFVSS